MGSIAMTLKLACLVVAGSLSLVEGEGGEQAHEKWLTKLINRKQEQILIESQNQQEIPDIDLNEIGHDTTISEVTVEATKPTARKKMRRGKVIRKKKRKINVNEKEELGNLVVHPEFDSFPIVKTLKKDEYFKAVKPYSRMLEKLKNMVIKEESTGKGQSHKDYMEILSTIQQKQNYDLTVVQSEMNSKRLNEDYLKPDSKTVLKIKDDLLKEEETSWPETNVHIQSSSPPALTLVSWEQLSHHQ